MSIVALHRSAGEARRIAEDQLLRAAASRATCPRDRWMEGAQTAVPLPPAPADAAAGGTADAPAPELRDSAPGSSTPEPAPPAPAPEFGQGSS